MFHDIPETVVLRMRKLEQMDARDRADGTTRQKRLRQIPPEVGKFIALLATTAPAGHWVEIGTSAGYSTLWLALACREARRKVTTYEILPDKAELARETFERTEVRDVVEFVHGNAVDYLPELREIAFCFLDAQKEIYAACFELLVPKLVPGGILIADNAISHAKDLRPMLDKVTRDERLDALIVPIGKGELVCRKRAATP